MLSAIGYMSANICLRSVTHLDPIWVSCMKAFPTTIVVGPFVLSRLLQNQTIFSSHRAIAAIVSAALIGQVAGNVCFQWSLGVVGLALAVPLTMGAMILGGAILGRLLLGDLITVRMGFASTILVAAIAVLSLGAPAANASITQLTQGIDPMHVAAGVFAACLSGVAYSILSVALRYSTNQGTPLSSLLFTVGIVGFVLLGGMTYARNGWEIVAQTSSQDWLRLFGAGLFNLIAFVALTKALHLSSVMFVNGLNASQIAMAAIAGVLLFQEPITLAMGVGVTLTVLGLASMRGRRNKERRKSDERGVRKSDNRDAMSDASAVELNV
jgi:drug/metabolite transporter (DMT)-like permease